MDILAAGPIAWVVGGCLSYVSAQVNAKDMKKHDRKVALAKAQAKVNEPAVREEMVRRGQQQAAQSAIAKAKKEAEQLARRYPGADKKAPIPHPSTVYDFTLYHGQIDIPHLGEHVDTHVKDLIEDVFDCSQFSNLCVEGLRKAGYNAWVAASDTHDFVLVKLDDGRYVAYEPQDPNGYVRSAEGSRYSIKEVSNWAMGTSDYERANVLATAKPVCLEKSSPFSPSFPVTLVPRGSLPGGRLSAAELRAVYGGPEDTQDLRESR